MPPPPPSHQVCELLLRSLAEQGRYDEPDFCCRLDTLMDTLDGTAEGGRYTDVAMREVWRARKRDDRPWGQAAGWSNTSEAAQRAVVLAARCAACYALACISCLPAPPAKLGKMVACNEIVHCIPTLHSAPSHPPGASCRYAADLGEAARLSMSNIRLTHQVGGRVGKDATSAAARLGAGIALHVALQRLFTLWGADLFASTPAPHHGRWRCLPCIFRTRPQQVRACRLQSS